jgi:hypothetical protein
MDLLLTILAIIIGPIAAVQVQRWIEVYQENKNRKLNVFKTLMATRGARVSFEHVRALNMIDTEFYDEIKVKDAWKCYLDCLNENPQGEHESNSWSLRKEELFVSLLSTMATLLNYHFDSVHLKKSAYFPKAHGEEQEYQYFVRDKIKKIFAGDLAIPVKVTDHQATQETLNTQTEPKEATA